jgi:hypothetical protein
MNPLHTDFAKFEPGEFLVGWVLERPTWIRDRTMRPGTIFAAAAMIAVLALVPAGYGKNKDTSMITTHESKAVSVSINRPPNDVYRYLANPENFPHWAPNFCHAIRKSSGNEWIADTTMGALKVRFVPENEFHVADHYVTLNSGEEIQNPIRVLSNGTGSEVVFMVFRRADVTDEDFRADWGTVQKDLEALKRVLER